MTQLGDGFGAVAETVNCPTAAAVHEEKPFYGVQFHPESRHTEMVIISLRTLSVNLWLPWSVDDG